MPWDWTDRELFALEGFLGEFGLCHGPVTPRPIGDGHSNLTFLVSDGQQQVVVRRPPAPPTPPGAHDVQREATVMSALRGSGVPVPDVLAIGRPGEVFDVGFFVMSFTPGPVVTARTPSPLDTPEQRRLVGEALVDTLARLHAVNWADQGLADFGRPEGFNERHLTRIGRLVERNGHPGAEFAAIFEWLLDSVPPESGAAIVHNDYRLGNVILAEQRPARIAAVLDWELATIGDPLFDLGYFLASCPVPGRPRTPTAEFGTALLEPGYPSRAELAQRYADRTGADLSRISWYTAMALWKLAVLYEYGRRRAVAGRGDPYYNDPAHVRSFLTAAHEVAGIPVS